MGDSGKFKNGVQCGFGKGERGMFDLTFKSYSETSLDSSNVGIEHMD